MLKRVHFEPSVLPFLLVAPQIIITVVFFIWPASQALYQSLLVEDAFGLSTEFVWFDNFIELIQDEHYLGSFQRTIFFSFSVAFLSMSFALALAAMADRVIKGAMAYRTLLIWPYAVAPVVSGALWVFMFDPTLGIITYGLGAMGHEWNHKLNGGEAMTLVIIASAWKQVAYNFLFFLAGMQAIPKSLIEAAAIDGAGIEGAGGQPAGMMMFNSLVMALMIAIGKIAISLLSAFAIVYFRFPFRMGFFWMIFITLMLPVEVRILPTFEVVANLGMLNSYWGLSIPLIASATATFMFRQVFLTIPDELLEAARIDGAGPLRFFKDILVPMSRTNIAAMFVIMFIYGWNQYLWPLLVTTDRDMYTIVMGIKQMLEAAEQAPEWNIIMMTTMLAMLPPVVVVIVMQKLFVKGLTETEK